MRIYNVKISNFRTIHKAEVNFYDVTSFVGPNGVGKSTILYALDWFFNGGSQGILTNNDATYGCENEDIEVRITFNDLNETDREVLGKYVGAESTSFTAWKVRSHEDGRERLSANIKGYELFTDLKNPNNTAAALKALYKEVIDDHPNLRLDPNVRTKANILAELTRWESEHVDQLVSIPEELSTDFKGFNSNSALATRFKYTLVKADLRANEESEDSRKSLLSEIIERTVDRKSADDQLVEAFSGIKTQEKSIYDGVFGESLTNLTNQLNSVVNDYTSNRSIEITPNIQEINPPKTTFKIQVNDGEYQTDVTKQGHGFQRTLLISSLQMLSEQSEDNHDGVLCLAIEEPELFQHPLQAQVFASVLRALAENPKKEIQVTYATHSPYFLESQHFSQIYRLVRQVGERVYETTTNHASLEDVKCDVSEYYGGRNRTNFLENAYANDLAIGVFSHGVILVEGSTDKVVLEGISKKMGNFSLARKGIAVIGCGSKENIPPYYAILKRLGIPTRVMFDNDSGWETRFKKTDPQKIKSARLNNLTNNKKLCDFFNIDKSNVVNGFPKGGKYGDVFVVEDTLEPYLKKNWIGWQDMYDCVNQKQKISSGKNEEVYAEIIKNLPMDKCPQDIIELINDIIQTC